MFCGGLITCVVLPPFQSWDELQHFLRAAQIATGTFFPVQVEDYPGGMVDQGYVKLEQLAAVNSVPFHYERKFDQATLQQAATLRLENALVPVPTPNVGYYFPTGYLPQALGLRVAALFTDRVLFHLIAARMMNCAVACALVFLALWIFPPASPLLIAVAALPVSLFLLSSASQDASLIALSILLVALCLKLLIGPAALPHFDKPAAPTADGRLIAGSFGVTLLLALGRPSYLPLGLVPALVLCLINWRRYWLLAIASPLAIAVVVSLHVAYVHRIGPPLLPAGADPAKQLRSVFADPAVFLQAFWNTMRTRIPNEMIGIIGWGETPLPPRVFSIAHYSALVVIAATAVSFASLPRQVPALTGVLAEVSIAAGTAIIVVGACVLTGFAIYLEQPLGETSVLVVGRYFVPFIGISVGGLLCPFLADPLRRYLRWFDERWLTGAARAISVMLLGIMIASFVAINVTLIDRYYLN